MRAYTYFFAPFSSEQKCECSACVLDGYVESVYGSGGGGGLDVEGEVKVEGTWV